MYIGNNGVIPAVSPKSYSNFPPVRVGHDAGSTASNRTDSSVMNGNAIPPRFDPPPQDPITTSGPSSPASCNCSFASSPMIVWWSSTWFSTDPSA